MHEIYTWGWCVLNNQMQLVGGWIILLQNHYEIFQVAVPTTGTDCINTSGASSCCFQISFGASAYRGDHLIIHSQAA